jgi:hypothetical protein
MRVLDPWYAVWSDAEVCAMIRVLHEQQAQRVAAVVKGVTTLPRPYVPRACDQEIIPVANFGSGLQYFSPAAQQVDHLLLLQERLRPLLESGDLNAWQLLFICNHRPERLPVLERCLEAGARIFTDLGLDSVDSVAEQAPKPVVHERTAQLLLEAVATCLPPGTNYEEIDNDGNYLPVDPSLSQPFPYAWQLGERRTQLDAEMEQFERVKARRRGDAGASERPSTTSVDPLSASMQQARLYAQRDSVVERAEAFAGPDLVGAQPIPPEHAMVAVQATSSTAGGGSTLHTSRKASGSARRSMEPKAASTRS